MTHPSPNPLLRNAAFKLLAAGLISAGLFGCADMSGITPQAQLRDGASLGLDVAATGTSPVPIDAQWWRAFGDEQLNQLEAQALQHNPNLGLAQARVASAQAFVETANASTKPQLVAQLDATHQRYTANGAVPPPLAGSVSDSATAQLNASWEADFFGKNRAALNAALGQANAAQADAQAAQILLASQVARSYFQWVRLNEQITVARRTLAQREETLKLVQDRVNAGLDTQLELRQSQGGLPEARLQLEILSEQQELARHALAALVSEGNRTVALTVPAQSAIKQIAITTTIPADLLGQRADIAAARWRVEAATRSVQSAKAQFYPNVNLVAFAGFSSIGLDKLLQSGSQQWGVGPALRLPIFDGGRLRAGLRGKTAELDAAVESYNSAVLNAVRDVADQITSAQAITRQQTEQAAAGQAAQDAYDIALQRYRAGLGNYLTVLNAESTVLTQRRLAVDLSARALDTQVALIHALGGGYSATHTSNTP
jgi:NodT family efflux transporter outer membrane factor (OMF) lipoprotein